MALFHQAIRIFYTHYYVLLWYLCMAGTCWFHLFSCQEQLLTSSCPSVGPSVGPLVIFLKNLPSKVTKTFLPSNLCDISDSSVSCDSSDSGDSCDSSDRSDSSDSSDSIDQKTVFLQKKIHIFFSSSHTFFLSSQKKTCLH